MRTGWSPANRNGVRIAQIAEAAGVQALSVHGRTRACMFRDTVEYETIRAIKAAVKIPVIANGDIDSVQTAREVLKLTQADAVMIGRGALGRPWIFSALSRSLDPENFSESVCDESIDLELRRDIILSHLNALHRFYGEQRGVRVARKHLRWYCKYIEGAGNFWHEVVQAESAADQLRITTIFLDQIQNSEGGGSYAGLLASRNCCVQQKYAKFQT